MSVCSYDCALCGVTGERKKRNVDKKVRNIKNKQKKAAVVFDQPEQTRSHLAGVTVNDLNRGDIDDPYFPEWFVSRTWKRLRPPLQLYSTANSLFLF